MLFLTYFNKFEQEYKLYITYNIKFNTFIKNLLKYFVNKNFYKIKLSGTVLYNFKFCKWLNINKY